MVDTIRPVDDLLNNLFEDGQLVGSITEQDMRDAIVSIYLANVDLSALPRSASGLNVGRLWLDNANVVHVVTQFQPALIIDHALTFAGQGGLAADGRIPGVQIWSGASTLRGAGGLSARPTLVPGGILWAGSGVSGLSATSVRRLVATARLAGTGGLSASAVQRQRASARFSGSGGVAGSATAVTGGVTWGTVNSSITKSNGNLTVTKSSNDGVEGNCLPTAFKTSGKYYWEIHVDSYNNLGVGLGNPSVSTADGAGLGDGNSYLYYTFQGVGGVSANGTWQGQPDPFGTGDIISIALDIDNGGWWARVNGGGWAGAGGGGGDPVSNANPLLLSQISTTGGLGIMASLGWVGEGVTLKAASSSWTYSAPTGFGPM